VNGRRVLITGGAGFIGSHLAEALIERGFQVSVIDDLSTGRFENIAHLVRSEPGTAGKSPLHFVMDSITNEIVLDRLMRQSDIVFHLAAAVGVKLIVEHPVRTLETNVMGTDAVLRTAHRHRVKVVLVSSSEVYGKGNGPPFSEEDDVVLGPTCRSRWAYGASKMLDEFLGLAYHREKGLPIVIVRFFNIVGRRQTGQYGMVIPRFVGQALSGHPLTVYGDGCQARCFLHVHDAVSALMLLEEDPEAIGQVFNIGSTERVTILELAHKVMREAARVHETGSFDGDRILFVPYDEAYSVGFEDMLERVPDITKIQKLTGWAPKYSLEETLRDIIAAG